MYSGEAQQDKFVLQILKEKKNGYFVEIGSSHPMTGNNSYLLEIKYDWKGIMIEYDKKYLDYYEMYRPNSVHVINDATQVDYRGLFERNNVPFAVDYLQIDLEVGNGSTLTTLKKLDNEVLDKYKFATITFEHDIYQTNFDNTRLVSRDIFKKRGYVCVFEDVNVLGVKPFEDWYVHPDLVDMNYVVSLMEKNKKNYVDNDITGKTICWEDIQYI